MGLGPTLAERELVPCTLKVWVPEKITEIEPSALDRDFAGYRAPFTVRDALFALLTAHLHAEAGGVVIADTSRSLSDPWPDWLRDVTWFSCSSPSGATRHRVCVLVDSRNATPEGYARLVRAASPYPTVLTLTSLPQDFAIRSGEHLEEDRLRTLLDRVAQILVGVFDERSMMIWTRTAQENLEPCPEIL